MKISEMLDTIQAQLVGLTSPQDQAFVVGDMSEIYRQLFIRSTGLRILIAYTGETIREHFPGPSVTARVDRKFIAVVTRGRSLNLNAGDSLTDATPAGDPLFDLVEKATDMIRCLQFDPDTTERPTDYIGCIKFPTEGLGIITDAYQIEFSVGCQLLLVVSAPNSGVTPS
jgi:hypothetical protein